MNPSIVQLLFEAADVPVVPHTVPLCVIPLPSEPQPKKIRKVPPGLPSSVSTSIHKRCGPELRSTFCPWEFPHDVPFHIPFGIGVVSLACKAADWPQWRTFSCSSCGSAPLAQKRRGEKSHSFAQSLICSVFIGCCV